MMTISRKEKENDMIKSRYIIQLNTGENTWADIAHVETGTVWRSGTRERAERHLNLLKFGDVGEPPVFNPDSELRIAKIRMEMPDKYATSDIVEMPDVDHTYTCNGDPDCEVCHLELQN